MWTDTFKINYINKYPNHEYILWNETEIKNKKLFKNFKIYEDIYNAEET